MKTRSSTGGSVRSGSERLSGSPDVDAEASTIRAQNGKRARRSQSRSTLNNSYRIDQLESNASEDERAVAPDPSLVMKLHPYDVDKREVDEGMGSELNQHRSSEDSAAVGVYECTCQLPLACPIVSYSFTNLQERNVDPTCSWSISPSQPERFRAHLQAHLRGEPFKCYECGLRTEYTLELTNHACEGERGRTIRRGRRNRGNEEDPRRRRRSTSSTESRIQATEVNQKAGPRPLSAYLQKRVALGFALRNSDPAASTSTLPPTVVKAKPGPKPKFKPALTPAPELPSTTSSSPTSAPDTSITNVELVPKRIRGRQPRSKTTTKATLLPTPRVTARVAARTPPSRIQPLATSSSSPAPMEEDDFDDDEDEDGLEEGEVVPEVLKKRPRPVIEMPKARGMLRGILGGPAEKYRDANGSNLYACPERDCDKMFRRMEHLKRHSKIHSKVRPFECICGRFFS